MRVLDKHELRNIKVKKDIHYDVDTGSVFVYPTDTIYGVGCDATNSKAVKQIRDMKGRFENPFSVIAPSKDWIRRNCDVSEEHLNQLPGPVTLILNLKNKKAIAKDVNMDMRSIGVRMPEHWISDFVSEVGKPVVTTSVNKQGDNFITKLDDMHIDIRSKVDFAFNEGEIKGRPSKIINTLLDETIER